MMRFASYFCSAALLLSCIGLAQAQSSDNALYTRSTLRDANGEAIFRHICQGCHMPDAKGAVGAGMYPALANNAKLEEAGYPIAVIVNGQKAMPPLGSMFSDTQVADVVNYIRTHFGNHYTDKVTPAMVKTAR